MLHITIVLMLSVVYEYHKNMFRIHTMCMLYRTSYNFTIRLCTAMGLRKFCAGDGAIMNCCCISDYIINEATQILQVFND